MHPKAQLRAILRFILSFFVILLVSIAAMACRAKPAPDSGFIENPKQMHEDKNLPFNAIWLDNDLDWAKYSKILIRPVDTTHLEKMDWWDEVSLSEAIATPEEEAEILAKYFREQLIKVYSHDTEEHFIIVEEADSETLILEMAIVEVVPTKAWLNAIGYVFAGAIDFGSTAMEGRFRDGGTNQVIAKFKDREHGQMALVSVADLQWYAHAHHTIDHWSEKLLEITNKEVGEKVSANWTVTLRPW